MSYSDLWHTKSQILGTSICREMPDFRHVAILVSQGPELCLLAVRQYYFVLHSSPWSYILLLRDLVFSYIVLSQLKRAFVVIRGYGPFGLANSYWKDIRKSIFRTILTLPPLKYRVEREFEDTIRHIETELMKNDDSLLQFQSLPDKGLEAAKILDEMDNLQSLKHSDWSGGKVSGAVYHGGDDVLELQTASYHRNAVGNQLHPDVFPGIRKMESEIVSMVLNLFNAPDSACGSTTSGGTESLLLTGLAAREYGKKIKGITRPEVIAPTTVHAGIEKACYYFGLKLHKVPLDPISYKVDVKKVRKHINGNTVLLVGSAPNFPHGIIDDIEELSNLAVKYKIPLHVDACLGSFIVSFLEKTGVHGDTEIPLFDFRLPGVTSISCDTHKYGFAPKGSSIIMYRSKELRECQYYVLSDWTGGMYGSPTLAGSRPGALMAGCWATMVHLGEDGYKKSCSEIVGACIKFKRKIESNELLSKYIEVIGEPLASVVAFKSKPQKNSQPTISIYDLGDQMGKKGWHFSSLQNPAALHFAFTRLSAPVVDEMVNDLTSVVETLIEHLDESSEVNLKQNQTSALYGVAGSVKTSSLADRIIVAFLDTLYKV